MSEPSSTIPQTQPFTAPVGPEILLSLAVPTVLCGLACARTLGETIASLGITSEEIFRGDRLPPIPRLGSQEENSPAKS